MKALALRTTAVSLLITLFLAISMAVLPASALAAFTWTDLGTTSHAMSALIHVAENNTLYAACTDGNVYSKALPSGSWTTSGPGSSQPLCLAYDQANSRIFAGLANGHVWMKPLSGGWMYVGDTTGTGVNSLAYDSQADVLYAGCVDGNVWRSSPPGSWSNAGSPGGGYVTRLQIDVQRRVLYAGCNNGLVYRKSIPVGAWTSTGGPLAGIYVRSLAFDNTRNVLYAGMQVNVVGDPNVYRLDVGHGGSWTAIGTLCGGPYIPSMAIDEQNDYLFAGADNSHVYMNHHGSTGSTWEDMGNLGSRAGGMALDGQRSRLFAGLQSGSVQSASISSASSTWYLAEGSTAWGFDTYISIENPNASALSAHVTYMLSGGATRTLDASLPARSQTTVNPRDTLGDQDFSTMVVASDTTKAIAVDRTMTWTGGAGATGAGAGQEAHSSVGVNSPATTWYLPEGSTNWGFETWLLIQNPNATTANCAVIYMIEGSDPVVKTKQVPGNSRQTFSMAEDIGSADASIKVVSDKPVIPERAMYRNSRREGHDSIGTTTPAQDFYLAEGATGYNVGYTTYVLIQNPQNSTNDVTITYLTGSGEVAGPSFQMAATSRKTIRVNDQISPNTDVSTAVHGSKPIIAERAMYWDNGTGEACHDSIGMSTPHMRFYLPDGQTSEGRETWTLVQNPNDTDVTVEITYLLAGGGAPVTFTDTVGANSRKTYNMADKIPSGRAAVLVVSESDGMRIICERAMYWNSRGAGTDTIGGFSY
jgi:hypothetical protein